LVIPAFDELTILNMSTIQSPTSNDVPINEYRPNRTGLQGYLRDLADELFPFGGFRDYQQEILHDSVCALFTEGYKNIIIDGPTGIGKSPINITIGRVVKHLAYNKRDLEDYFGIPLHGVEKGNSFYTTPQKQLRNQLAEDEDLRQFVRMLKSRADYICEASGDNCKDCSLASEREDESCRTIPGCTYWAEKMNAMESDIAVLTFAMLVVDNHIPPEDMNGKPLSFDGRDVVIVDEGHNLENQVASLFAGFSVSSWVLPDEVYQDTSSRIGWNDERYEDVADILTDLKERAKLFIENYEEKPGFESSVEKCENFVQKVSFCETEVKNGRPWVVTVDKLGSTNEKKMTIKPVDVDNFLQKFIWSRGNKRVISSATIPYRSKIDTWADRIGLDGSTKLISRPMPFPEENRLIHKNTIVASMSGDGEDNNWRKVVSQIEETASKHEGENGLIHTTSYVRAKKLADALGMDNVIVHNWKKVGGDWIENERDTSEVIHEWQESDKDVLLSPSMMEGVDLHDDLCRWQVLMKVPYAYVGDSRVSYLLNERHDWEWYNQTAMLDVMQSVGRAVRGPDDYASYYVIDAAFNKLMSKVETPDWFGDAVRSKETKF
jgi:Rad3-related DNA helicase